MRSNPAHQLFCIFQLDNILWSYLNFSTSYGRLTDLKFFKGLFLVRFILLREKISLKYLLLGGEERRLFSHAKTGLSPEYSVITKTTNCLPNFNFATLIWVLVKWLNNLGLSRFGLNNLALSRFELKNLQ